MSLVGRLARGHLRLQGLAVGLALVGVAGCGSTNVIENAVPEAALRAAEPPPLAAVNPAAANLPNVYPNLNIPQQPANTQISPPEGRSLASDLRARRSANEAASRSATPPNSAELRRIGERHAQDTLRAIEGN
jgi:uncharacterized lipoprotein